jgi:ureidoglycolate hydrolase
MELRIMDLSREALRGIGQMLTPASWSAPEAGAEHSYADTMADLGLEAPCSAGVVECAKRPRVLRLMERHQRTPEMIVFLDGEGVACLAPPQEAAEGRLRDMVAVRARAGQAFLLERGAWHSIPFPVGRKPARFLVVFRSGTGRDDLEYHQVLESPVFRD